MDIETQGQKFAMADIEKPDFSSLLTHTFPKIRILTPMNNSSNAGKIKEFAEASGFDLFGVADITIIREGFLLAPHLKKRFPLAISLAKRLNDSVIEDVVTHPTELYLHHYRQVNFFLDRGALCLADRIQKWGFQALPIPASQIIDWKDQKAHLSHKQIAALAGLGWIGRNNLLVNQTLGARFRLVTVLTDMPLSAGRPVVFSCGDCRACQSVCPASAIKDCPEEFNHLACYEKLKEFRQQGYTSQYICGICVKACRGFRVR